MSDNENIEDLETQEDMSTEKDIEEQTPAEEVLTEALITKLKTLTADYENYRNRNDKEKAQMYDRGIKDAIFSLLPVMDNFALATKNIDPSDNLAKGVLMIQGQLDGAIEALGVEKIPAVGKTFDINLHNAVTHVKSDNHKEQEIMEELQTGYTYKGSVIRHSMVVVAN